MREGRDGGGYKKYTQDKDRVVEEGIDSLKTTYDEEVYEYHRNKQRKIFEEERESKKKSKFRDDSFATNVAIAFTKDKSYAIFDSIRQYYKNEGGNFTIFFEQIPIEDLFIAKYIYSLYKDDMWMTYPDYEYVRRDISEKVAEGNYILYDSAR